LPRSRHVVWRRRAARPDPTADGRGARAGELRPAMGFRRRVKDDRRQLAFGFLLPAAGYRLMTDDYRLPTASALTFFFRPHLFAVEQHPAWRTGEPGRHGPSSARQAPLLVAGFYLYGS